MLLRCSNELVYNLAHDLEVERLGYGNPLAKFVWHRLGAVSGCESKRYPPFAQRPGYGETIVIAKRHIQYRGINGSRGDQLQGLLLAMRRANRLMSILGDKIAEHHGNERFVVDNKHTRHLQITRSSLKPV